MDVVVAVLVVAAGSILGVAIRLRGRERTRGPGRRSARSPRRDSSLHRDQAEAAAEVEEHDIEDLIDAIVDYRRRHGRRDVAEELSDELMRGGWEKE
jgi:hypothetical protein